MASNTRDLVVRIIGDARQMKQATKEVESGLAAFESRVGKIGSALAGVFAGGALLSFGKQAAQAALEDQRAQERLAKTLENVTGATKAQVAAIEDYISKTESQYAVIDDELRPAFETLVRATKDTAQAQQMLQLALDVSAGSGKSLQEVSVALVKAMGGQMRGLKDLGIQVKTTAGDTASFADVQAQLNAMFGGQAAEAANSQTGEMRKLQIQYENLKESIGRALLPVMIQLANIATALFGWFNDLSSGTQAFIVGVVAAGAAAFTAVKAFVAIREAIALMNISMATSPIGAFAAAVAVLGGAFLASRSSGDDATETADNYAKAVKQLGFDAESTTALLNAFNQETHDNNVPNEESIRTFSKALKALGLNAKDSGLLMKWFTTPGMEMSDIFDQLSPAAQEAARSFVYFAQYAADMPRVVENGTKSLDGQAAALDRLELPLNSSQQSMMEWVKQQKAAAVAAEEMSKKTIAAFGSAFAYLEGLVNKDQAVKNLKDKTKDYFDLINSKGPKHREELARTSKAMALQNEIVLAGANTAALAAAAVPGFEKLTEAQKKVEESKFIVNWARGVQRTVEPGSPLWIALQQMIGLIAGLTGGSTSADMINSIQIPKVARRKRASGGPVAAGMAYTVGERGPETFVPATAGTILPNGAGGGGMFNVTINAGLGSDPQAIGSAVVSALKTWVRTNGKIAGIAA